MSDPLVRSREGVWGTLIFGACRECDWTGRARSASGNAYTQPGHVLSQCREEAEYHYLSKHGARDDS